MPNKDALFLAWAAGFFDGEGCVMVEVSKSPRCRSGLRTSLHATVTQTSVPCLELFRDTFGGSVNTFRHTTPNSSRWAVQYTWSARNKTAIEFLRDIQPYSVVKAEQIKEALTYPLESPDGRKYGNTHNPIPIEVWETRLAVSQRLRDIRSSMKTAATPRAERFDA